MTGRRSVTVTLPIDPVGCSDPGDRVTRPPRATSGKPAVSRMERRLRPIPRSPEGSRGRVLRPWARVPQGLSDKFLDILAVPAGPPQSDAISSTGTTPDLHRSADRLWMPDLDLARLGWWLHAPRRSPGPRRPGPARRTDFLGPAVRTGEGPPPALPRGPSCRRPGSRGPRHLTPRRPAAHRSTVERTLAADRSRTPAGRVLVLTRSRRASPGSKGPVSWLSLAPPARGPRRSPAAAGPPRTAPPAGPRPAGRRGSRPQAPRSPGSRSP